MKLNATLYRASSGSNSPAMYLIKNTAGAACGLLEKYPNTRTDKHPWKAFLLDGSDTAPNTMLGCFYGANGKGRAINMLSMTLDHSAINKAAA